MLRPEFVALDSGHCANHRRHPRNRRHAMPDVSNNAMEKLLACVNELDRRRIHRRLAGVREAVMVEVHVPGARWEVEFFADGHVEVEVFRNASGVLSHAEAESALQQLLDEDDQAEGDAVQQSAPHQYLSE